jgi:hypothetical protein
MLRKVRGRNKQKEDLNMRERQDGRQKKRRECEDFSAEIPS